MTNEELIHSILNTKEGIEDLYLVAEDMARSLGHLSTCPYITSSIKCNCGSGKEQATALDNYERLKQRIIDEVSSKVKGTTT